MARPAPGFRAVTTRQGRPPKAYRSRAWKICLPEQLAGKYELLLMDPTHGTPERGARQEIFIALLQRVLDALQSGEQTIFVGHGKRRFGGTILGDRILPFRDRLTVGIRNTIQALALDPLGTAQAMAKRLSACMYCGQRLSDDESKARGYGPICAEHYGLPWGAVSAADRKEAQRIRTSTLEELFS